MDALRKRRDVLFERMKWEHKNASSVNNRKPPVGEIQERLNKLTDLYDNFDKVQSELEETTDALVEVSSIFNHRLEFEKLYYETKGLYVETIDNANPRGSSEGTFLETPGANVNIEDAIKLLLESQRLLMTSQAAASNTVSQLAGRVNSMSVGGPVADVFGTGVDIRLPTISLPIFNGDRKQWNSFKDLFESCVHTKNLRNSVKLQYLLAHLDGDAKKMVSAFTITDANYIEVWNRLNEFYNKPKYTVSALVREFVDQPSVSTASLVGLRKLVATSDEVVRQLKALGPQHETRDPWLIHLLLEKLDRETRTMWAQKTVEEVNPTFGEFLKFLEWRCDALESCASFSRRTDTTVKTERKLDPSAKATSSSRAVHGFSTSTQQTCPHCYEAHTIYQCADFREISVAERRDLARNAKLCFNCLKTTHPAKNCTSTTTCKHCKQRHHSLLCTGCFSSTSNPGQLHGEVAASKQTEVPSEESVSGEVTSLVTEVKTSCTTNFISMLPTAAVKIKGKNNVFQNARAIVDSACMNTLITKQAFNRLGLERRNANILVSGISDSEPSKARGSVMLQISSRFDDQVIIVVEALIMDTLVPNQPCETFDIDSSAFDEMPLADPNFNRSGKIDLLLGIEVFFSILEPGKLLDPRGVPVAQNSIFGYLVGGRFDTSSRASDRRTSVGLSCTADINLDQTLRRFWELEELPKPKQLTEDEQRAVDIFRSTLSRTESGRYVVRLPFDTTKPELGESANAAIRRFKAVERKFSIDPEFKQLYTQFMAEYQALGHMERVPSTEVAIAPEKCFYLPHHAVWKADSTTTKLRVVFDASNKSDSGVSLNDRLLVGPNVNEPLFNVFARWRTYKIAFCADVQKMYRQVLVSREDADYQRIVFREDPNHPLEHYRLLTVTYGTASAAYQAVATLHQIAEDNRELHPLAASRIPKNFYVDDLLSGADTVEEAEFLRDELVDVLNSGGFVLRKWSTNEPKLLDAETDTSHDEAISIELPNEGDAVKALGIRWIPSDDAFYFKVTFDIHSPNTKRQLLSDASKLFDPFGWIAPVVIKAKILFQYLWLYNLNWDDPLPATICEEWIELKETLHHIERIRIKRWIPHGTGRLQLHGFADASEAAYAAVVYARSEDHEGRIQTNLVAAKTKVAPIQQVSLPRLELMAAELLTDLMMKLMESFSHLDVELYAWSDSTIVLQWLGSHPRKWKTFVANRTSKILEHLPIQHWNHVSTRDNPADCASRGISPTALVVHPLWWRGPAWLHEAETSWPQSKQLDINDDDLLEARNTITCLSTGSSAPYDYVVEKLLLCRSSSLPRARRSICWVNRFMYNMLASLRGHSKKCGSLTPDEVNDGCMQLARAAQHDCFKAELESLQKQQALPNSSKLKALYPFVDSSGTLRVGGRLQNSDQPYDVRHPVVLPKDHRYTHLLLLEIHEQNLHAGAKLMIATLNQRYWIVSCQALVRSFVDRCYICCRMKGKAATQLMGSLPAVRTMPARPFLHCGVDYAGPLIIRTSNLRSAKTTKGYVAVFVCLSTKAVHLEAVTDLSTNAFLAALKRFISRRGLCAELWSDHGTNFVGADREIRRHLQSKEFNEAVSRYLTNIRIKWTFITPSAPHMGGIWEAAVKAMKKHLRVVLGNTALTFEDLSTVLAQIEACLNSRPLCSMSTSPESCDALTPGHFIIGHPLNALPEPNISHLQENRLDKWQRLSRYVNEVWSRWSSEYLSTLQPRNKWQALQQNLVPGQLVVIKGENLPPTSWELARITQTHPDQYGIVRTVTVRRGQTEYQRPVHKLVPLPCD